MTNKTVVLFHGHCADGFGAAWSAYQSMGDTADYVPVQYGAPVPDITQYGAVYCIDFSYPRDVLEEWRGPVGAWKRHVMVLDHHVSAQKALAGLDYAIFDLDKSGAMLAWEYFHPWVPAPPLVRFVQDRDLWRFALPHSREVSAALWSYPQDFDLWTAFDARLQESMQSVVDEGSAILRYMAQQTAMICDQSLVIDGVPTVNATNLWSEVGEELLRRYPDAPYVAAYYDTRYGKRKYSLRSRGDFDVSKVATAHGGGGHAAAAGYEVSR